MSKITLYLLSDTIGKISYFHYLYQSPPARALVSPADCSLPNHTVEVTSLQVGSIILCIKNCDFQNNCSLSLTSLTLLCLSGHWVDTRSRLRPCQPSPTNKDIFQLFNFEYWPSSWVPDSPCASWGTPWCGCSGMPGSTRRRSESLHNSVRSWEAEAAVGDLVSEGVSSPARPAVQHCLSWKKIKWRRNITTCSLTPGLRLYIEQF